MTAPQSVSLAQLISGAQVSDNETEFLALLTLAGFPATAWQSGSIPNTIVNTESSILADLGTAISAVAQNAYLPNPAIPGSGASLAWLDLLGNSFFQEPRSPATILTGQITLTDAANAGPFTITPQQTLWVSDGTGTIRFSTTNAGNVTIPLGGSATFPVQGEFAGATYNLANNSITILQSSLPGVVVTNPPQLGTSSWITTQGNNAESDVAYAGRLAAKWSLLGTGSNAPAYVYNTLTTKVTGTTEPTRATVFLGDDVGSVDIVVAGASGPISAAAYALVNTVLQAKRPLCTEVNLLNAAPTQTVVSGNVGVSANFDPVATLAAVQNALGQLASSIALGGTLFFDQIIQAIMNVPGVYTCPITSPVGDTVTGLGQVVTLVFALTSSH